MSKPKNIPKIPYMFFRWYCRPERYEELHGDLEELYYEKVEEEGIIQARWHYLINVIRCCRPYAWKKQKSQTNSNFIMLRNYYFTAFRNLVKHKNYFLLNISGLAMGIASFILISLYLVNELSYDRFHPGYENIYRVQTQGNINGQVENGATSNNPLAKILLNEYAGVEKATRIRKSGSWLVGHGTEKFYEHGVLFADSTFFNVFNFRLLKGDPKTALIHPRSMILTEAYARKYFGDEDPMGRSLIMEQDTVLYTVTGIVENLPANSHIQFDMLGSMSTHSRWNDDGWVGSGKNYTYIVLNESAVKEELEENMQEIVPKYIGPEIKHYTGITFTDWQKAGNSTGFYLMPLKDIYLHSGASEEFEVDGNVAYIYLYGIVGIIILFIAIFNFVNLATAQSATRAKEVGVRKVMGSSQTSLMHQFIVESVVVSLIATIVAVLLVRSIMPSFVNLIGKELAFGITSGYAGPLLIIGLALFVGFLAGVYPAFVLSRFQPVSVLRGTFRAAGRAGLTRSFLVIIQFTASVTIMIGTLVIYDQIDFMLTKNLGFDKEQVLIVERPDLLGNHLEAFKNDLLANIAITSVTNSETIPGKDYAKRSYRQQGDPETYLFKHNNVGLEYAELMGLEIVSGRFFSRAYGTDINAVVINESALEAFGFDDPIGKDLISAWRPGEVLTIIGVIKNYNIESLHKKIEPVAMELITQNRKGYISVKLSNAGDVRKTVGHVDNTWAKYTSEPLNYYFFDEDYQDLYQSESRTGKIFIVFAMLSVFIACLGLIGLITFTTSARRREMGIRKVLGAGTASLVRLLSSEITRLILIATIVSWPAAYLASDYWLQNFVDRTAFDPWVYLWSTLIVVIIGSIAISFQTVKTALGNPVDVLKQE